MELDSAIRLTRELRRGPVLPAGSGSPVAYGRDDLHRVLPHRGSMLLLDRVEAIDPASARLRAHRTVRAGDPVFEGHFPDQPVYPGVLLVEMMGQAALALLPFWRAHSTALPTAPATGVRLTRILHAAFFAPVLPGTALEVHGLLCEPALTATGAGQVFHDQTLCALAVFEVYLDD